MKFDISKQWCEQMANLERGYDVSAGAMDHPLRKHEYETCPICRGYHLERSWCDHCNKSGLVKITGVKPSC